MAKLPELDFFTEKQAAYIAVKNFNIHLQEVFKEYKKVWGMYLKVVNEHQKVNSKSFNEETTQIINQDDRNSRSSDNLYFEEPHTINLANSMEEDTQQQSTLNLFSSNESLKNINEMFNSPIFSKSDSNSISNSFNKNVSMISPNKSTSSINNLSIDNEQEISNETSYAFAKSPMSSIPSVFLCSTPIRNKKVIIKKKQNVKNNARSKILSPSNNLRKRNNLSNIRKEKALNKTPLKIINNMKLIPNNNSQMNRNNNNNLNTIQYNIEVTQTSRRQKFKQTKLVFNKTTETMESLNNIKSNNAPVLTKTNKSVHNQEKVLRQSTLTDMISSKKRKMNNVNFNNIYNQSERCNDTVESIEIKNELIYHQECELINSIETHDPSNISNKSDSTFLSEYENNISLDQSSSSLEKLTSESESMNQLIKKKKIIHLSQAKENVIDIIDLDELTEKSIESSEDGSCTKCKRYRKDKCWHNSNDPIKKEATSIDFCIVMSPDNSSSTT